MLYIVPKIQPPNYNTFWDMNYFLRIIFSDFWSSPDRQTESDAYEPTLQIAQVGSKMVQFHVLELILCRKVVGILGYPLGLDWVMGKFQ